MSDAKIGNVSDTSLWVAYYRAKETDRPDALFRDPLAKTLVGARGKKIADDMVKIGRYTEWSVITRTVIIDDFILRLVQEGVDTVINLGAGLDTRPYRMSLPAELTWVEVDYPHIIAHKNKLLSAETPKCRLERVALDLADSEKRREFFSRAASRTGKALIITEGVIPYLAESQVSDLANDLHMQAAFHYWIAEYFSPEVYPRLKSSLRTSKMENAPFQFYPADWNGFFGKRGWVPKETRYSGEESIRLGRGFPMPWWAFIFKIISTKASREKFLRMTGYILFERA